MHYRFYCLNPDGSFASGRDAEHSSDLHAMDAACAILGGASAVEVWTGTRFVGRLANPSDVSFWPVQAGLQVEERGQRPE